MSVSRNRYSTQTAEWAADSVGQLQIQSGVAVGQTGEIRSSLRVYTCASVLGDGTSRWVPADGVFRPEDFSANMDDSAIRSALEAAEATGVGRVHCHGGTWQVYETIEVPDGVRLSGDGRGITVIEGQGISAAIFSGANTAYHTTNRNFDAEISDLTITNTSRNTAGGVGIDARQWTSLVVQNVQIHSVETGVRLEGVAYYNRFEDVDVTSCKVGYTAKNGANSNTIRGGRVSSCSTCAIDFDAGPDASSLNHFLSIGTAFEGNAILARFSASSALPIAGVYILGPRLEGNAIGFDLSAVDPDDANAMRDIVCEPAYLSPGVVLTRGDAGQRVDFRHVAETRGVKTRGVHRFNWYKELTGSETRYGTPIDDLPAGAAAIVSAAVIGIDPADTTVFYERRHRCFIYRDGASAALHAAASVDEPTALADAKVGSLAVGVASAFSVVSNDLRLNVTGEVGRNMKFWMAAEWQIVNEGTW